MRRTSQRMITVMVIVAVGLGARGVNAAEIAGPSVDQSHAWFEDPTSQMVFFSVLEGLYPAFFTLSLVK